jgi:hypothetical protein
MTDATVKDFVVGDVVQHVFHGIHGVVTTVGRKLLTVSVTGQDASKEFTLRWLPTSVRKVGHLDLEHEKNCNGRHWTEMSDGSERRVHCGCECEKCSQY